MRNRIFCRLAEQFILPAPAGAGTCLCFDLESDGLLDEANTIHCAVIADLNSDRIDEYGPDQIDAALARLAEANYLTGHNIVSFDLPLLDRLYGWTPKPDCIVVDTLIASRLILSDIAGLDDQAAAMGDPKLGALRGRYSVEAWGARLGITKSGTDIEDFSVWSPELQARCVDDTKICVATWRFLHPDGQPPAALALEHRVAGVCDQITAAGIPFDRAAAEQKRQQWTQQRTEREARLRQQFPQITNFASRQQLGKLLESRGWVPAERTKRTRQAKLSDEILEDVIQQFPEFAGLSEYFVLGRRLGQLANGQKSWLHHVGADGRIHGGLVPIGTPHFRAKHLDPNLAQVPNPKRGKPFASECRALFHTSDDWVFVTCDQSGLQDRNFAHYLAEFDGGAYARAYVAGLDPHWAAVHALDLMPMTVARDKNNKLHAALREGAKSFRYGFLFGAQGRRAGIILSTIVRTAMVVDPNSDLQRRFFPKGMNDNTLSRIGRAALDRFIAATPGLKEMRAALEKRARCGWIPGLDGRKIPVRALYTTLNYAVTSAEAIICKQWLVTAFDELHTRWHYGWDGDVVIVAWIHDEIAVCCRSEIAEQVGEVLVRHARAAGEHYGLHVPLDAEFKIGLSWGGEAPETPANEAPIEVPPEAPAKVPVKVKSSQKVKTSTKAKAPTPNPANEKAAKAAIETVAARYINVRPPSGYNGGYRQPSPWQSIPLAEIIGEELRYGKVLCPFHDDHRPSLHVYHDHFYCFTCHAHGDHVDWLCNVEGLSHDEAIEVLTKYKGPRGARAAATADDTRNLIRANELWDEAQPIAGTLAVRYLAEVRGIDVDRLPEGSEAVLRFHPRCPFNGSTRVPCLLALYRDVETDAAAGIHRIALTPEVFTGSKVERRTFGCWAKPRAFKLWPAAKQLFVGEGIETVLAAATRETYRDAPMRPAWATGSSGYLARLPPIAGVNELIVLVDNDPSGKEAADACYRTWKAAGRKVTRLLPRSENDFNDIVLKKLRISS